MVSFDRVGAASAEYVEIVRQFYEAQLEGFALLKAGKVDELLAMPAWQLLADDFVIDEVSDFPDADRYRGQAGFLRYCQQLTDLAEEYQNEPCSFEQHGNSVLVDVHQRFRGRHGPLVEYDLTHLLRIRNGKITYLKGYLDRAEALRAATE